MLTNTKKTKSRKKKHKKRPAKKHPKTRKGRRHKSTPQQDQSIKVRIREILEADHPKRNWIENMLLPVSPETLPIVEKKTPEYFFSTKQYSFLKKVGGLEKSRKMFISQTIRKSDEKEGQQSVPDFGFYSNHPNPYAEEPESRMASGSAQILNLNRRRNIM